MVNQIALEYNNQELRISNKNKCHFLRSSNRYLEVAIYYPEFKKLYFEASDSVIFHDTLHSDTLSIQMHEGGGSMVLNVDNKFISIVVSEGAADYTLAGKSVRSEIKIQNKGFADASKFTSNSMFIYQNSTSDLKVNVEGCSVNAIIAGSGNLYRTGSPTNFSLSGEGGGALIEY
jgi:hypothetical protein